MLEGTITIITITEAAIILVEVDITAVEDIMVEVDIMAVEGKLGSIGGKRSFPFVSNSKNLCLLISHYVRRWQVEAKI